MTEPACPFCGAGAVERVGQWGGQIITAQWRCQACHSYFEAVRDDFDDQAPAARTTTGADRDRSGQRPAQPQRPQQ